VATEPEMVVHSVVRAMSHGGLKAWNLLFTNQRIILVKKGTREAFKVATTLGIGATTGAVGAAIAGSQMAKGTKSAYAGLDAEVRGQGIEALAAAPENVVIDNSEVHEILLKQALLGAPELRIVLHDGRKWRFGLYDTVKAVSHFEPLRSIFGSLVRHK